MITSQENPKIKHALSLRQKRARRQTNEFSVEGTREVTRALKAGFSLVTLFYCDEVETPQMRGLREQVGREKSLTVSKPVLQRLAQRDDSQQPVAVFKQRPMLLESFAPPATPAFFLVAEGIEKPGNLGALLRSADGAGVSGVLLVASEVDCYNPNVIRASLGTVFTVPIATCNAEQAHAYLKGQGCQIYAASPDASLSYDKISGTGACAVVVGSEARGLSKFWQQESHQLVKIPMLGDADSLNVSVASSILLYEVCRQRLNP